MKFRIKHKTKGWTGTIYFESISTAWGNSHRCGGEILFTIDQDSQGLDGEYVEDPWIISLDELEFINSKQSSSGGEQE